MKEEVKTKCNPTIKYFAKEILAPIVMNGTRLDILLNLNEYSGNPFLQNIFVQVENDRQNIVAFFKIQYELRYSKGVSFLRSLST